MIHGRSGFRPVTRSPLSGATGNYPVTVVFSGAAPVKNDPPVQARTSFTATCTQARPPLAGASQTFQA
jgi:hypothetical protein